MYPLSRIWTALFKAITSFCSGKCLKKRYQPRGAFLGRGIYILFWVSSAAGF